MVAVTKNLTPRQLNFPTEYADASQCKPFPPLEQFIQGIMNAKFVITDSFHGLVFSIIFGKPFVAIVNKNRGAERMESLLQMFHLEDHLICDITQYKTSSSYKMGDDVSKVLDNCRKKALDFLKIHLPYQ
jgi:exopolysaccharide biosynthesis predicted pyruvyltransferase EpsI